MEMEKGNCDSDDRMYVSSAESYAEKVFGEGLVMIRRKGANGEWQLNVGTQIEDASKYSRYLLSTHRK